MFRSVIVFARRCCFLEISEISDILFNINFLSVRLVSVLRGHSVFFHPPTTANDLRLRSIFYPRFYQFHLLSYLNSREGASISLCSVLNKGTTGTIFITSDKVLDWGLNPGPPALDANTLPPGYRRGGARRFEKTSYLAFVIAACFIPSDLCVCACSISVK